MTDALDVASTPPSILLVILDIHPLSWSLLANPTASTTDASTFKDDSAINLLSSEADAPPSRSNVQPPTTSTPLTLSSFITNLLIFLNAHLASRWGNKVVFLVAGPGRSRLLYPNPSRDVEMGVESNIYHPFRLLDQGLEESLRTVAREEEDRFERADGEGLNGECLDSVCAA